MNDQEEKFKAMFDIIGVMVEKLKAIRYEIPRIITDCDHLRAAIISEIELSGVPHPGVVDPLKAPEVDGTGKDGDYDINVAAREARILLDE